MKAAKFRELKKEELKAKLAEFNHALSSLRTNKAKGELKNTAKISQVRHDIARVLTIIKEGGLS